MKCKIKIQVCSNFSVNVCDSGNRLSAILSMFQAIHVHNWAGHHYSYFGKCYNEKGVIELHDHLIGDDTSAGMEDLCALSNAHYYHRQGETSPVQCILCYGCENAFFFAINVIVHKFVYL